MSTGIVKNKSGGVSYDSFDIIKAVLALFVVELHFNPLPHGLYVLISPVLRLAVPLFFVMSAYFFFSKISFVWSEDKGRIGRWVARNAKLYLFWFIAVSPVTFLTKDYISLGLSDAVITFVKDFFLNSTFKASWYLMALVEAMLLVYVLRKLISTKVVLVITSILYVFCLIATNYHGAFESIPAFQYVFAVFDFFPGSIEHSFIVGMFWTSLGLFIAEREKTGKALAPKGRITIILFIVFMVLLYCEKLFINIMDWDRFDTSFIMLVPAVYFAFVVLRNWKVTFHGAGWLRKFSTITYCSHASAAWVIRQFMEHIIKFENAYVLFFATIAACVLITIVILWLEKFRYLRWLKYAH